VDGHDVILVLKIAVVAVTVLLLASLVALARGRYRLHGRLNVTFFTLTLIAVLGLEVVVRLIDPSLFAYIWDDEARRARMVTHLCFSVPALVLMSAMLYTGLRGWRWAHVPLAVVFGAFWVGTFVTGIFYLD
jgi:hypothetical protein